MNHGRIIFSQIVDDLPRRRFKTCVERYRGDHRIRTFTCLDQFYCMSFAQLTGRESLRDIEACLLAVGPKLYHAGMKARVSRNTLAKANEQRDWQIYRDMAMILIEQARMLYGHQPFAMNLIDFRRLYHLHQQQAFFVIRAKNNQSLRSAERPL